MARSKANRGARSQGKYRTFSEAREYARSLGLNKRDEWVAKSGQLPPDIPRWPQNIYAEFVSWEDWLGRRVNFRWRSFLEARAFMRSQKLNSRREHTKLVQSDACPKDIPSDPATIYASEGWAGFGDYLGLSHYLNRVTILALLRSLQAVAQFLEPVELFAILQRKGMIGKQFPTNRNADVLRCLEELCRADDPAAMIGELAERLEEAAEDNAEAATAPEDPAEQAGAEIGVADTAELGRVGIVPTFRSLHQVQVIDRVFSDVGIDDPEILEFLIANRVAMLWQAVLNDDPGLDLTRLRNETGEHYFAEARNRFLLEYDAVENLIIPASYQYQKDGEPAPPSRMQRLTAYRVLTQRRVGNWSGVGAGKTVAAILAALVTEANLTVVIAFNATLARWEEEIKQVCPFAVVAVKDRGPYQFETTRPAFVLLNYEMFQQPSADAELLPNLSSQKVDFLVLDEIQSVRQREHAEESNRRRRVRELRDALLDKNPELRILGMSATPVINELHEARVTLELVTARDFGHLPVDASVSNAIAYHQQMVRHGLRYRPDYSRYALETRVDSIDGHAWLNELRQARVGRGKIAALERILLKAKLPYVQQLLRPGTLVYTEYVTEIVDELRHTVSEAHLSCGVFTGEEKDGLAAFLNREVDVLIGSSPIGTGVDGLQRVCNRLVFAMLPWTAAHYDQIVGRLRRQHQGADRVEVFVPVVELRRLDGAVWSWDRYRLQRIAYKRTIADAVIDGVIPAGRLPSPDEMVKETQKALEQWLAGVAAMQPPTNEDPAPQT